VNDFAGPVRKALREGGATFLRQGRGDHEIWTSPHSDRPFTVPTKIKSRHTANGIMRDAGLPKQF
jgi:predicted RNA binding protein YcfA (HicA-like mRNA interferase family)